VLDNRVCAAAFAALRNGDVECRRLAGHRHTTAFRYACLHSSRPSALEKRPRFCLPRAREIGSSTRLGGRET